MATQKQIDANRRNAAKSTGPRSVEGKAASRFNAVIHGIFAESPTLLGEHSTDFDALRDSYLDRFLPATPEEATLVANIVGHAWYLGRFPKIEAHVWNIRLDGRPNDSPYYYAQAHALVHQQLGYLQLRIDSAERNFRHDLELLIKLQTARNKTAPAVEPTAEPIPEPESAEVVTPEIGFVPSFSNKAPNPPPNSPAIPTLTSRHKPSGCIVMSDGPALCK